ncbi:hypothetical protein Bca52824_028602 [Brassica carinata]|uniref:Uncharacterized protein n=1 Tax=Brassica carinata TaxID=52824 RepID=A0A8X7VD27_BRACI|nr:hypothetical protein Bca52824_028602 [Brassica carinata]
MADDVNTSIGIHSRGWTSSYISPDPPAFLGCMPPKGPVAMVQWRRWGQSLSSFIVSCLPIAYYTTFPYFPSILDITLKLLGISKVVLIVTQKTMPESRHIYCVSKSSRNSRLWGRSTAMELQAWKKWFGFG